MSENAQNRFVVAVLLPDRTGILRDITGALTDLGANIDNIRETVVDGYFSVILICTFTSPHTGEEEVRTAVAGGFSRGEASVVVRPFQPQPETGAAGGRGYVVTVMGEDKPGILKRLTAYFAETGINVEEFECRLDGPAVTYVGEVTVPARLSIRHVQDELGALMEPIGMRCRVQHRNIFRAINEVGPIGALLREVERA